MAQLSPFERLGLSEDASGRELKRAYARLLKQHRPDQDPEGFSRIHEAYQQCLELIEFRDRVGTAVERPPSLRLEDSRSSEAELAVPELELGEPVAASEWNAIGVEPEPRPDPFAGVDLEDADDVQDRMCEGLISALQGKSRYQEIHALLENELPLEWRAEAIAAVDIELFAAQLERGDLDILRLCLQICERAGFVRFALNIAWHWMELVDGPGHEELLQLGWNLAPVLSISYPQIAEKVTDHLFAQEREARRHGFAEIENLLLLGQALQGLPEEQKHYWSSLIFSDLEADWTSAQHRKALETLAALPDSEKATLLLESYLGPEAGLHHSVMLDLSESPRHSKKNFFDGGFGTFFLIYLIIKALFILVTCGPGNPPSRPYSQPSGIEVNEEDLKRVREMMEALDRMTEEERSERIQQMIHERQP